jgi:adenosylcobinamide-GDP ribazoletransferase
MVVVARAGKSVHEGMNSVFLQSMNKKGGSWRLIVGLSLSLLISILVLNWAGFFSVLAAVITGLAITVVAHKHFKGVTGDVFGATNEITRMTSAIVLLAVILW